MEEEEIYIDLFDRYNRNEIDRDAMVNSLEEIDSDSDIDREFQCYQTALILLEQRYLKDTLQDIEAEYLAEQKSKIRNSGIIPLVL